MMPFARKLIELGITVSNAINQTQKDRCNMFSFISEALFKIKYMKV